MEEGTCQGLLQGMELDMLLLEMLQRVIHHIASVTTFTHIADAAAVNYASQTIEPLDPWALLFFQLKGLF